MNEHTATARVRFADATPDIDNHHPDMVQEPFFLVGCTRSGTTLTRLMLDHHPLLAFFFEFEYAVEKMPDHEGWPDLHEYREFLRQDRIFQAAKVVIDAELDYPRLIDSFLRQKQDRDGKPLVGATVHHHFDRLLRIWPDARFIHIVRDGRDVARSSIEMGWAGNIYTAVERWIEAELLWSKVRSQLPADRSIEIRYEALVSAPQTTLTRVCEFLGVPYDSAMLDYPAHTTYGPPSPKAAGQWKSKLSPNEVRLAEARIGDMLIERGYELSGYPPLEVSPAMARRLQIHSRYNCLKFRRKRFGTGLVLADWVTRRCGPRSMQRRVKERINAIETKYLK